MSDSNMSQSEKTRNSLLPSATSGAKEPTAGNDSSDFQHASLRARSWNFKYPDIKYRFTDPKKFDECVHKVLLMFLKHVPSSLGRCNIVN